MYKNKDFTVHQEKHAGGFTETCEFCEIMEENGIWWGGNYYTNDELIDFSEAMEAL